ncbi:Low temperature viability protein [Venturia nashicola]|uniref:Low temperature viability protein n=1 Tax=Venturia nashicola TaxID=86259 RepID=A0A4Z1P5P2_9PEZI|nr:Low temperature viability protein [Venturia nashicola]TLD30216.1 Low temperature viability protein [Venturia nashicola]
MPPRRVFDKKNATTFSLVYRAQNDPRIHDAEASDMVFTEKSNLNQTKGKAKQRIELEEEFGSKVRENEGEAANHGIYYDDSNYDYMQHMRDLGTGGGQFVEASGDKKGKGKMTLEDQLRNMDMGSDAGVSQASSMASTAESFFSEDLLPSQYVRPTTYQNQQNVPDAIAGFKPDMDPRLREVLEALDDEAYVEDDEDIFEALAADGEEVHPEDFEDSLYWDDDEDEGWESDRTIKADQESPPLDEDSLGGVPLVPDSSEGAPPDAEGHGDGSWMEEFSKFKKDVKSKPAQKRLEMQESVITGASSLASGRKKKRKGALTSASGYSMTSSVLSRTEGQTMLDAKFDKIEEEYADDEGMDDSASMISGMTGYSNFSKASTSSQAPSLLRSDFNSIMEDFQANHSTVGKKRVRKGKPQTGLEQLDEVRQGLGAPRVKSSWY